MPGVLLIPINLNEIQFETNILEIIVQITNLFYADNFYYVKLIEIRGW